MEGCSTGPTASCFRLQPCFTISATFLSSTWTTRSEPSHPGDEVGHEVLELPAREGYRAQTGGTGPEPEARVRNLVHLRAPGLAQFGQSLHVALSPARPERQGTPPRSASLRVDRQSHQPPGQPGPGLGAAVPIMRPRLPRRCGGRLLRESGPIPLLGPDDQRAADVAEELRPPRPGRAQRPARQRALRLHSFPRRHTQPGRLAPALQGRPGNDRRRHSRSRRPLFDRRGVTRVASRIALAPTLEGPLVDRPRAQFRGAPQLPPELGTDRPRGGGGRAAIDPMTPTRPGPPALQCTPRLLRLPNQREDREH